MTAPTTATASAVTETTIVERRGRTKADGDLKWLLHGYCLVLLEEEESSSNGNNNNNNSWTETQQQQLRHSNKDRNGEDKVKKK